MRWPWSRPTTVAPLWAVRFEQHDLERFRLMAGLLNKINGKLDLAVESLGTINTAVTLLLANQSDPATTVSPEELTATTDKVNAVRDSVNGLLSLVQPPPPPA